MFEVKLQQFSGPLNKLLELIQNRDLEITEIALASVTEDFLDYLRKIEPEIEPGILSDFLVVASKLVLIKSKILLPDLTLTEEEEDSIEDLEVRLQIYKEFAVQTKDERKTASFHIRELWNNEMNVISRQLFNSLKDVSFFYPAPNLTLENLLSSLNNLASSFEALMPKTQKIRSVIISLENKVKELITRLKEAAEHSFSGLAEAKSREEIVVTFLAILHLFRKRSVNLEQDEQFGDILIKKR